MARDFSWHFLALGLVVAGLSLLAPLTWWQSTQTRRAQHSALGGSAHRGGAPGEPQIAVLRPLVAERIHLDPSILETPALPSPPMADQPQAEEPLRGEASVELRLSAAAPNSAEGELSNLPLLDLAKPPLQAPGSELRANPGASIQPANAWPHAAALVQQLQVLAQTTPQAAEWAARAEAQLQRLSAAPTLADRSVDDPLVKLRELADEGKTLAESLANTSDRSKVLRAGYAIVRRLVIWDQVHSLSDQDQTVSAPVVNREEWTKALADVDALLKATGVTAKWRTYLLIDQALQQFDSSDCPAVNQRQLARDILHRMHSTQLSHEQEQFLKRPALVALTRQLEARSAERPDFQEVLAAIEQYESDDCSAHSRVLASQFDALRWSPDAELRELADTLNAYYRNANLRVALSAELINRLIPQQRAQVEAVDDFIQGAAVWGQSHTNTQLKMTLLPDKHRWNIGLEAVGQVASNTSSAKGPARFYQDGWSFFRARKRLTVDRRGIRLFTAEAEANSSNSLNDFETDFDGIPLLGGIARAIARNQYDETLPAAKVELEGKIIVRATTQLDREVAQKLDQAKRDFQFKLVDPLRNLELEPTAVDMETTAERLIARYRMAARDQVSAHTPRPQAPGDSILSVQIHQSALNNVLERLNLSGRRVELRELFKEMTIRFRREPVEVPEDLPEDVYVTFADEDPVRVDAHDGRVRLTIRLKELSQGPKNHWRDFTVRGYYVPSTDQLDANLVRDGIIELIGDNRTIPIGQQVALRGIFARVLSRNRKLNIINKQIAEAPELHDQQVTQFVIHDGWIGVALGPHAAGRQVAMQPRPELPEVSE